MSTTQADALVIGCGLMGSALATALASAGYDVVVWNRTPKKAVALRGERIRVADSIDKGVASAAVLVVCLTSYSEAKAVLAEATDLANSTIINLCSGSPQQAQELASWCASKSARYFDGAIISFPADIGTVDGGILFAGPSAIWEEHQNLLQAFGGPAVQHISTDITAANTLNTAIVGSFFTVVLAAFVESAVYGRSRGLSAGGLLPLTGMVLDKVGQLVGDLAAAIDIDDHATDQATIAMWGAGAQAISSDTRADGQPAHLISAVANALTAADSAGFGELGITALSKVWRSQP